MAGFDIILYAAVAENEYPLVNKYYENRIILPC